jgi:IclR family acetate operon transcriptional repressor
LAVKRSQSASRVLTVFEEIARAQPIGVSALARALGANKSAVQRDLMTLSDAGWIRPASGEARNWELTHHVLTLARPPHSSDNLRLRIRPLLERLRVLSDETVYLTVPHQGRFVVIEALESHHMLRVVPPVGMVVPVEGSATAKAMLAHLSEGDQARLIGAAPPPALQAELAQTRMRGYAVNDGDVMPGSVTLASALLDANARPLGALVVTGPAERMRRERWPELGGYLRDASRLAVTGEAA